jgi:hypothetical protein
MQGGFDFDCTSGVMKMATEQNRVVFGRPATDEEKVRLEKFAVDYAASSKAYWASRADEIEELTACLLELKNAGDCLKNRKEIVERMYRLTKDRSD